MTGVYRLKQENPFGYHRASVPIVGKDQRGFNVKILDTSAYATALQIRKNLSRKSWENS